MSLRHAAKILGSAMLRFGLPVSAAVAQNLLRECCADVNLTAVELSKERKT